MRSTHQAIVLRRTDYGEGDRILTLLTPDLGKISALAKGVRRPKSKLAGGIEPFSLLDITVLRGRGELYTVTSSRMQHHFDRIITDYDRLTLGYLVLKRVNQAAETLHEAALYELLHMALAAIDDPRASPALAETWFHLQYIRLLGHGLNTARDNAGNRLKADSRYEFSFSDMALARHANGRFAADHIKLLRLLESHPAAVAAQVGGVQALLPDCLELLRALNE